MLKVGGGYLRVLRRLWLRRFFGLGAYRKLRSAHVSLTEVEASDTA